MGRTVIKYLGHIISFHGVAMDPSKVSNVLNWHVPRTIKGVREFLKLTGYYCRFIGRYGSIARPLTQLLKKEHQDRLNLTQLAQKAFIILKQVLVTSPCWLPWIFLKPLLSNATHQGAIGSQKNKIFCCCSQQRL